MTIITGTLHEEQYTPFNITRSVLRRRRNVSEKCCRENQNTYFVFNKYIYFFENCAIYDTVFEKLCKAGNATYHKIAYVHCVFNNEVYNRKLRVWNNIDVPLHKMLHEPSSMLRYSISSVLLILFLKFVSKPILFLLYQFYWYISWPQIILGMKSRTYGT